MSEFKDIRALIIDPSAHSKTMLRGLLAHLGVVRIAAVAGTNEALPIMRRDAFSIVFCDELVGPLNPFEFLKALRRDLTTRDVTVPVVLVSGGTDYAKIAAARDAGMNDVVTKPVSGTTIERKLRALLLTPRPFVTAKAFVGPDRRARAADDRRQFGERKPAWDRRGTKADGSVFAIGPRLKPEKPKKS